MWLNGGKQVSTFSSEGSSKQNFTLLYEIVKLSLHKNVIGILIE